MLPTQNPIIRTFLVFFLLLGWIFGLTGQTPQTNPTACKLNLRISDNNCPSFNSFPIRVLTAPGTALGTDVELSEVRLVVRHSWVADLEITLVSPSGETALLSSDNGGGGDHYGNPSDLFCDEYTSFSDYHCKSIICETCAPFIGKYRPEESLARFNDGSSPIRPWNLRV